MEEDPSLNAKGREGKSRVNFVINHEFGQPVHCIIADEIDDSGVEEKG